MNKFFGEDRRIFIADLTAKVMYLMIAGAFASNFFEKMSMFPKAAVAVIIFVLAVLSILLYPSIKGK